MNKRPLVIAICGGSGSGKTSLSNALINNLKEKTSVVTLDNYYLDQSHRPMEERIKLNYDSPETMDLEAFEKDLKSLKEGKAVFIPNYDFSAHSRTDTKSKVEPADIIIAEGIMVLLMPKDCFDFTIYVDAKEETRLTRRIKRDMAERGRSKESVIKQFHATVKPMHNLHVEPCKKKADFVFINKGNSGLDAKQLAILLDLLENKVNENH